MQKVTLKTPIKIGDKEIKDVEIRSPGAGELRGMSLASLAELEVDTVLKLLPRISKPIITEVEGEQISLPDLLNIGSAIINPEGKPGNGATTPQA